MWDQQCCLVAVGACLVVVVEACPVVGEEKVGLIKARRLVGHLNDRERKEVQEMFARCLRECNDKNKV